MPLEKIKNLSKILQLDFQEREDGIYQLWHRNSYSFIEFKHLKNYYKEDSLDDINKNEYCLSIKFRFRSWHASGDRTDLNDITSIIVSIYLRFLLKTSFKFIDIEHPILDNELELYGREIIPVQPMDCIIDFTNRCQKNYFEELILQFNFINEILFNIFECSFDIKDEHSYTNKELDQWIRSITQIIETNNSKIYNSRTNPKCVFCISVFHVFRSLYTSTPNINATIPNMQETIKSALIKLFTILYATKKATSSIMIYIKKNASI